MQTKSIIFTSVEGKLNDNEDNTSQLSHKNTIKLTTHLQQWISTQVVNPEP